MREGELPSADGVRAECGRRGCVGCAQNGGVVRMKDGLVTFKGGTISNTEAVRARHSCLHKACRVATLRCAASCARRCVRTMVRAIW
jgi:hypothetical protein